MACPSVPGLAGRDPTPRALTDTVCGGCDPSDGGGCARRHGRSKRSLSVARSCLAVRSTGFSTFRRSAWPTSPPPRDISSGSVLAGRPRCRRPSLLWRADMAAVALRQRGIPQASVGPCTHNGHATKRGPCGGVVLLASRPRLAVLLIGAISKVQQDQEALRVHIFDESMTTNTARAQPAWRPVRLPTSPP